MAMDAASRIDILRHLALAVVLILAVIGYTVLVLKIKAWRTKVLVRDWANDHGLQILDLQMRNDFKGPYKWWVTSGNHTISYVKVRQRDGIEKCGWVLCGSFWQPFWLGTPQITCKWEE
jgi:hypothetical protein